MRGLGLTLVLCGAALSLGACRDEAVDAATPAGENSRPAGADGSRCEGQTRSDRAIVEYAGPGANYPNIRRVYEVGSLDRDRILRCREVDTNLDGTKDLIRSYNERGEPLLEQADSNYDGSIDTWLHFAAGAVVSAEFDRNGDGKADEFRIYDSGKLARAQKDTNYDGKLDTWEVYDAGRLSRVGKDLDQDERVDRWFRDEVAVQAQRAREAAEAAGGGDLATAGHEMLGASASPAASASAVPGSAPASP